MSDEIQRLRSENRRLRELLAQHGVEIPGETTTMRPTSAAIAAGRTPEEKIKLFRELFRGREDVYAVRWESPDGRKGYSPNLHFSRQFS